MADDHDALLEARRRRREQEREAKRERWATEHAADLERRRLARESERAARRDAYRTYTSIDEEADFERRMADDLGMSIEAFRSLQAQRRAEIGDGPRMTWSPDHEVH